MNQILEQAEYLHKQGLPIRSIIARPVRHGIWDVQFVFELMIPLGESQTSSQCDDPGMKLAGWERYPDDHIEIRASIEGIEALMTEAGKVGGSDVARFDAQLPQYPQFLTKPVKWFQQT